VGASARVAHERLALGGAHGAIGYVAVNEAGEPYTPDTLTRMWHKIAKAAAFRLSRCSAVLLDGAPGRIRTCGLLLRRQTLYPLSYGGAREKTMRRSGIDKH
jgi:hypothetical protein